MTVLFLGGFLEESNWGSNGFVNAEVLPNFGNLDAGGIARRAHEKLVGPPRTRVAEVRDRVALVERFDPKVGQDGPLLLGNT